MHSLLFLCACELWSDSRQIWMLILYLFGLRSQSHRQQTLGELRKAENEELFLEFAALLWSCVVNLVPECNKWINFCALVILYKFNESHLWEWDFLLLVFTAEIYCSSSFHLSQTPHLPTSSFQTKKQTRETQPAKLLSLNCHQFILCSYLSVTLPQLWKNFYPHYSHASVPFPSPPYN